MNIKTLLLGSAAALVAVSGARAADAVVVAEPEAVEYVKVCDAYGAGFFYIPGTETCLKIGGYMRYDAGGGDDPYKGGHMGGQNDTYYKRARAEVRFDARTETELGTLRSYIQTRFQYTDGNQDGASIPQAFIELGGFRVGVADEIFGSWVGYAGNIINDDVIQYNSFASNQISYTYNAGNGFSAIIAAEQGEVDQGYDYRIDDYMPHVLVGAKYEQGWGTISGIAGYDSAVEEWGFKARLDVKFTDTVSVKEANHPAFKVIVDAKKVHKQRLIDLCRMAGVTQAEQLADALVLLVEGARVCGQSAGVEGPQQQLKRACDAMIAAYSAK